MPADGKPRIVIQGPPFTRMTMVAAAVEPHICRDWRIGVLMIGMISHVKQTDSFQNIIPSSLICLALRSTSTGVCVRILKRRRKVLHTTSRSTKGAAKLFRIVAATTRSATLIELRSKKLFGCTTEHASNCSLNYRLALPGEQKPGYALCDIYGVPLSQISKTLRINNERFPKAFFVHCSVL